MTAAGLKTRTDAGHANVDAGRANADEGRANALAGGASSPVRTGAAVGGAPFVQAYGRGAYAYDRNGRAYIDYVMAYGPLLFGHAHPALVSDLETLAARGTVFGSTHNEELRLAERIAGHLPSIESLRFVNTGTEAMMSAIRVARAFTKKPLVLRFAGNYHGHFDAALFGAGASAGADVRADTPEGVEPGRRGNGSAGRRKRAQAPGNSGFLVASTDLLEARCDETGITRATRAETIVARYNDLADVDAKLAGRAGELAAIAVEPIVGNMGLVLPVDGFLDGLFERARKFGALVIFDEVITWLRLGLGGAQGEFELRPDLTALGKAIGGGFPLAAFGGRADVMATLAPDGAAFTGGTFSGNPFCVALGHRVLDLIESDLGIYERLGTNARALANGMRAIVERLGFDYPVTQYASMVDLKFRPGGAPRNYDEASQTDRAAFAAYYHEMRKRGVLLPPSPNELMFLSTEHGPNEIERTLGAFEGALRESCLNGIVAE